MGRAPQRTPTLQELAQRVSRLEKQTAEMVNALANSAVHDMAELRHALFDGRDELRRAFADTATRELVTRLDYTTSFNVKSEPSTARSWLSLKHYRNDQVLHPVDSFVC